MHIELTDHLRCPMSHDESFVVLLPDAMDGRLVTAGHLGCPVCGWATAWTDAIPDFGGGTPGEGIPAFDAAAAWPFSALKAPGAGWPWLAVRGRWLASSRPCCRGLGSSRSIPPQVWCLTPPSTCSARPCGPSSAMRCAGWSLGPMRTRWRLLRWPARSLGSVLPVRGPRHTLASATSSWPEIFTASGEGVAEALERAAKRGVAVYLVMDGVGNSDSAAPVDRPL